MPKRRARIYAEVAGYAASEAYRHGHSPRRWEEIATTMRLAMADAGLTPANIDYINAHATSTTIGDAVETKALRQVFRTRADKLAINATKSLVGHTLGAAGAIGGIATVLAIHTGQIHPTANYEEPDPACALRGLSSSVQERKVKAALLNDSPLRQQ